jgi:hypothetical protein
MRGAPPAVWPRGTGQWHRLNETRTVIVSTDPRKQSKEASETLVVLTPLDVIARLEDEHSSVLTVVLEDPAAMRELKVFLHEAYPWLEVVSGART